MVKHSEKILAKGSTFWCAKLTNETKLLASSLQWFNFRHVKREGRRAIV